ncbi:hypothetical protein TURU_046188 [Turdus rufiventris]|nr:hypothetical protein TURU_046188 [Turdus rufiventris]
MCQSRGSPAAPGADPGESGCPSAAMEVHGGTEIILQPWRSMVEQRSSCSHRGPWWSRDPPAAMEVHGGTEIILQPMEVHVGAEILLEPREDSTEAGECLKESLRKPVLEQTPG